MKKVVAAVLPKAIVQPKKTELPLPKPPTQQNKAPAKQTPTKQTAITPPKPTITTTTPPKQQQVYTFCLFIFNYILDNANYI